MTKVWAEKANKLKTVINKPKHKLQKVKNEKQAVCTYCNCIIA